MQRRRMKEKEVRGSKMQRRGMKEKELRGGREKRTRTVKTILKYTNVKGKILIVTEK